MLQMREKYYYYYEIAARNRVCLEKLTAPSLWKELSRYYEKQIFITVYTTACYLFLF